MNLASQQYHNIIIHLIFSMSQTHTNPRKVVIKYLEAKYTHASYHNTKNGKEHTYHQVLHVSNTIPPLLLLGLRLQSLI